MSRTGRAPPRALSRLAGGALDTGLDLVAAIGVRLTLVPGARARLTFATAAAASREQLDALVDKHRQPTIVDRVAAMSHNDGGDPAARDAARRRELGRAAAPDHRADRAAVAREPRGGPARRRRAATGACCGAAISGDRPIPLATVSTWPGWRWCRRSSALRLWTQGGLAVDLVVVNTEPASHQPGPA